LISINEKIIGYKYINKKINDDISKYIIKFIIEEDIKKYYREKVIIELKEIIYPKTKFNWSEQLKRINEIPSIIDIIIENNDITSCYYSSSSLTSFI